MTTCSIQSVEIETESTTGSSRFNQQASSWSCSWCRMSDSASAAPTAESLLRDLQDLVHEDLQVRKGGDGKTSKVR